MAGGAAEVFHVATHSVHHGEEQIAHRCFSAIDDPPAGLDEILLCRYLFFCARASGLNPASSLNNRSNKERGSRMGGSGCASLRHARLFV